MQRAHTIRLNPTPEQQQYFRQAAGNARFAWNWAVALLREARNHKEYGLLVPENQPSPVAEISTEKKYAYF